MKRRLALSIGDQAVISAFNFALNLYLIKLWSPEEFGLFTIIAAAALFTTMVQNAVINTPLAVHLPAAPDNDEKDVLRRAFSAANVMLVLLVLLLSGGGMLLWFGTAQLALVGGAALYMGSQFMREFHRSLFAVEGRLGVLIGTDLAYVVLAAVTLAVLRIVEAARWQSLASILLVLGATGVLSVLYQLLPKRRLRLRTLPGEMRRVFGEQKHEIRWSLFGAITTDIQNRGYLFVAAAFFGPATVAHLQAGRIFFGPLGLITNAWARVARPQLAKLTAQNDRVAFTRTLLLALYAFIAFNLIFLIALWLAWPYLSELVFSDKYKQLGTLAAAWGAVNIAFQIRSCLSIGVQALRQFRELTLATIAGAVVSVVLVVLACSLQESAWLVGAVLGGESMAILVIVRILRRAGPRAALIATACA